MLYQLVTAIKVTGGQGKREKRPQTQGREGVQGERATRGDGSAWEESGIVGKPEESKRSLEFRSEQPVSVSFSV